MARSPEGWTLHKDARTGIYTVRWRRGGSRHHRSTGTRDRSEAQAKAPEIVARVDAGRNARGGRSSLHGLDVIKVTSRWLAAMGTERRPATINLWETYVVAHWARLFASAEDLASPRELARYVEKRLTEVSASTVRKECSALQSLLAWCARPSVALLEQAPKVPRPAKGAAGTSACPKVRVDLTPEQAEDVIAALPFRLRRRAGRQGPVCRPVLRVLWETGLRIGTLARLRAPEDYQVGATVLRIPDDADKSAYGRAVPLTDAARAALDRVCPKSGPLFELGDYRYQLRKAAIVAGIPEHLAGHLSHHDFRHARTTALLDRGASLTGVAFLVGHRRVTTTDGYAHAKETAARDALATDSGHQTGHGGGKAPPETQNPAARAGSISRKLSGLCGREDSNLHTLSGTRSLVYRSDPQGAEILTFPGSEEVSGGGQESPSGHGVPIERAALAVVEAVQAGDDATLRRVALDLAELVADALETSAEDEEAVS